MKFEFKALPNQEAIDYFRGKGNAPALDRFSWKDVWGEEHARAFTVAKATRDDVLKTIRGTIDDAIANGTTLEAAQASLTKELKQLGWWGKGIAVDPKTGQPEAVQLGSAHRLRTILDTNIRTANSAGRWARAMRNKALMPFFTYIQIDRPTKREAHVPFHGVTLPVDHGFWKTHWAPNGWFCKCLVRQISRRVMERDGLKVTGEDEVASLAQTRPFYNERTGETVQVPIGIDPGFENNPGLARYDPGTGGFNPVPTTPASQTPVARRAARVEEVEQKAETQLVSALDKKAVERAVIVNRDTGTTINSAPGERNTVGLSASALNALNNPKRRMKIVHSHPDRQPLSRVDLGHLARSGTESVVAVGEAGFRIEARKLGTVSLADIELAYVNAMEIFKKNLRDGRPDRDPPPLAAEFAQRATLMLMPRLLSRRGLIVYAENLTGEDALALAPVLEWLKRAERVKIGDG